MAWKSVDLPTLARPTCGRQWQRKQQREAGTHNAALEVVARPAQHNLLLLGGLFGRHPAFAVVGTGDKDDGDAGRDGAGAKTLGEWPGQRQGRAGERRDGGRGRREELFSAQMQAAHASGGGVKERKRHRLPATVAHGPVSGHSTSWPPLPGSSPSASPVPPRLSHPPPRPPSLLARRLTIPPAPTLPPWLPPRARARLRPSPRAPPCAAPCAPRTTISPRRPSLSTCTTYYRRDACRPSSGRWAWRCCTRASSSTTVSMPSAATTGPA